jgi:hypothetical protein
LQPYFCCINKDFWYKKEDKKKMEQLKPKLDYAAENHKICLAKNGNLFMVNLSSERKKHKRLVEMDTNCLKKP